MSLEVVSCNENLELVETMSLCWCLHCYFCLMDDQCTLLGEEKFGSVDNLVELVQRLFLSKFARKSSLHHWSQSISSCNSLVVMLFTAFSVGELGNKSIKAWPSSKDCVKLGSSGIEPKMAINTISYIWFTFGLIFLKQVLVLILQCNCKFSLTCKLNSFSHEWLSTRPGFEKEAKGNSEMA